MQGLIRGIEGIRRGDTVVLCFPYAGGGASFYYRWQALLPDHFRVCPVQLPGREDRMGEKAYTRITDAADDILRELAGIRNPIILFGHSMGTKLAYEVEKRLEGEGRPALSLIVSACPPPHCREKNPIGHLPDEDFSRELIKLNGVPQALAEDPDLLRFFLPLLRGDFLLSETYCCETVVRVQCPVRVLGGRSDSEAEEKDLLGWRTYNPARFSLRLFDGDHFYIRDHLPEVIGEIARCGVPGTGGIVA